MIKANEIRLGNWVKVTFDDADINFFAKIDAIKKSKVMVRHWHPIDKIVPIPLTIDIMAKAGFKKYEEKQNDAIGDSIEIWEQSGFEVFFDIYGCLIIKDYHFNINRPQYLHQLQNLYHALSGEELTINL